MLKRYISRFNGLTLEFRHKFSEWQSTGESYDGKDVHAASSAGTFPRKAGDTDFVIIIGCQSMHQCLFELFISRNFVTPFYKDRISIGNCQE